MISLRKTLLSLSSILLASAACAQTLYTCGDSTMATYAPERVTRGWGQYLHEYFSDALTVENRAKGGKDAQGFYYDENYWPAIKAALRPGDYVLLQFAHNDEKNSGMDGRQLRDYYLAIGDSTAAADTDLRGSIPSDTYISTLTLMIEQAHEAGATPILAAPICRMYFGNDGDIKRNGRHDLGDRYSILTPEGPADGPRLPADDHTMDYRWQMEQLADRMDVPFIDLTEATREAFRPLGKEQCHALYSDGDGSTHLNDAGARLIGKLCTDIMRRQGLMTEWLLPEQK